VISSQKYCLKVHLTNFEKLFDRKIFFLSLKIDIHIVNVKQQKMNMSPYYFLFYIQKLMSSCRKPEI